MVKQQVKLDKGAHVFQSINRLLCSEGVFSRLFKQLYATALREMPFCSLQIPLWEFLKIRLEKMKNGNEVKPIESAVCGALAGGTAAALTMPVDVAHKIVNVDKVP
jgi:solute carrier family 25 S-adenosylmethionine transporter 26